MKKEQFIINENDGFNLSTNARKNLSGKSDRKFYKEKINDANEVLKKEYNRRINEDMNISVPKANHLYWLRFGSLFLILFGFIFKLPRLLISIIEVIGQNIKNFISILPLLLSAPAYIGIWIINSKECDNVLFSASSEALFRTMFLGIPVVCTLSIIGRLISGNIDTVFVFRDLTVDENEKDYGLHFSMFGKGLSYWGYASSSWAYDNPIFENIRKYESKFFKRKMSKIRVNIAKQHLSKDWFLSGKSVKEYDDYNKEQSRLKQEFMDNQRQSLYDGEDMDY